MSNSRCFNLPLSLRALCAFVLLFVFYFHSTAESANSHFYIKEVAAGTRDAKSWANAGSDLFAVLSNHKTSDTAEIWVAKGTYSPPNTIKETSFILKKGIKLYGGFNGDEADIASRDWIANETVLDGQNFNYHVVSAPTDGAADSDTRIDGFTITRGNAAGTLSDRNGGGIFIERTSPTIANCKFISNKASLNGGAIYVLGAAGSPATPFILNCSFSNNQATGGGAIYTQGAASNRSSASIVNCTFSGNSVLLLGSGGAIYHNTADTVIINCTFSENSTALAGSGGGIYNHTTYPSLPLIVNTIFWKNTGGDIVNPAGNTVLCMISQDPRLLPFDGRIYPLSPDSPALMAGEPAGATVSAGVIIPSFDQRGVVRALGISADIGAFQLTTPPDNETVSEDEPPQPPISDDEPPTQGTNPQPRPQPSFPMPPINGCNSIFPAFAIFFLITLLRRRK